MNNNIPKDPIMLASFINMKLRDEFPSIDELCSTLEIDVEWLNKILGEVGMEYDKEARRFW